MESFKIEHLDLHRFNMRTNEKDSKSTAIAENRTLRFVSIICNNERIVFESHVNDLFRFTVKYTEKNHLISTKIDNGRFFDTF